MRQVSISQIPALIVHIVLAELTAGFTTFCHCTMFYRERKELKNGVKVNLDRNESQIRPTDQSEQIRTQFRIYADVNCRLKIHFLNDSE